MMTLDPTAFLNTTELAIDAKLNGVDVVGIFSDLPSTSFELVDGSSPTFTLPATDVDSEPRGQALVIAAGVHPALPAGGTYTVRNFRNDSAGFSTLTLEAA